MSRTRGSRLTQLEAEVTQLKGQLRTLSEAALCALAAMTPVPVPPPFTGDAVTDLGNLVAYQIAVAAYGKGQQQLTSSPATP